MPRFVAHYRYKSGGKYRVVNGDDNSSEDDDEGGETGENREQWEMESLDKEDIARDFPDALKLTWRNALRVQADRGGV